MIHINLKGNIYNGRFWDKFCAFDFEIMSIPQGPKFCYPCF
jgi:hypothetical protein